jgi:hypothetical protein
VIIKTAVVSTDKIYILYLNHHRMPTYEIVERRIQCFNGEVIAHISCFFAWSAGSVGEVGIFVVKMNKILRKV